jgi:hypothetical protein
MSAPGTCWEDAYRVQVEAIKELRAENAGLREQIADLRKDKERLDWLDETGCWLTIPGARNFFSGASRAVIDAARKEEQT